MKNFIYLFCLSLCFLFCCNNSLAQTTDNSTLYLKGANLKFVKNNNNSFDLIEYDSKYKKKNVISKDYKIKKKQKDNKTLYIAANKTRIMLYSEEPLFSNILPEYYNQFNNIKFLNYPNEGTIKYSVKSTDKNNDSYYYSLISIKENFINMIKIDKYNSSFYPLNMNNSDKNSIMYKLLNVSYKNLPNCGDFESNYNIPAYIDEDISIKDGKIYITYKNIIFQKYPNLKKYKNLNLETSQGKLKKESLYFIGGKQREYLNEHENIQDLYNKIEDETPFKFIDYPQNFMISMYGHPTYRLLFFENGKKTKEISGIYDSFYLTDDNMLINHTGGIERDCNISYQNQNRIIAHKKGMKWGIINKENNVKVPFIYDKILPIGGNVEEKIINENDIKANQLIVKYMGKTKEYNLFFAIKDSQIGVINDKNEIIVNFEPIQSEVDMEQILSESGNKVKEASKLNDIGFAVSATLTAPLWIPLVGILSIWFNK